MRVWDLRVTMPGVGYLDPRVLHTLEHFLGHEMGMLDERVLMAAPLGCGTGLYIVTTAEVEQAQLLGLLSEVLDEIGFARTVPLATAEKCGRPGYHDLAGAQAVAAYLTKVL